MVYVNIFPTSKQTCFHVRNFVWNVLNFQNSGQVWFTHELRWHFPSQPTTCLPRYTFELQYPIWTFPEIVPSFHTMLLTCGIFGVATIIIPETGFLLTPHVSACLRKTRPCDPPQHLRYCFYSLSTIYTLEAAEAGSLFLVIWEAFCPEYCGNNFTFQGILDKNGMSHFCTHNWQSTQSRCGIPMTHRSRSANDSHRLSKKLIFRTPPNIQDITKWPSLGYIQSSESKTLS